MIPGIGFIFVNLYRVRGATPYFFVFSICLQVKSYSRARYAGRFCVQRRRWSGISLTNTQNGRRNTDARYVRGYTVRATPWWPTYTPTTSRGQGRQIKYDFFSDYSDGVGAACGSIHLAKRIYTSPIYPNPPYIATPTKVRHCL